MRIAAAIFVGLAAGVGCSAPSPPNTARAIDDAATIDGARTDATSPSPEDAAPEGAAFSSIEDAGSNTTTDPHHCGAGGYDCEGGACEDGGCVALAPGVLATGRSRPGPIALDDANVYWVDVDLLGDDLLLKCAKTGCGNAPEVLAKGAWGTPTNLVVNGGRVYWGGSFALHGCPTTGCTTPSADPVGAGVVGTVAVDSNGGVFYVAQSHEVFEATGDLQGGTTQILLPNGGDDAGPFGVGGMAIDGTTVFAVSDTDSEFIACDLGDCAATVAFEYAMDLGPDSLLLTPLFALDATNVYLLDVIGMGSTLSANVVRMPRARLGQAGNLGGDAGTVLVSSLASPTAIASDGIDVYFADQGAQLTTQPSAGLPGGGLIGKCPAAGCNGVPLVVKDYLSNPAGIAVDGTNVYVTEQNLHDGNQSDGRVWFRAK